MVFTRRGVVVGWFTNPKVTEVSLVGFPDSSSTEDFGGSPEGTRFLYLLSQDGIGRE